MQYLKEIWKDVTGYEGQYQVSSHGRIKSFLSDENGRILKLRNVVGYPGTLLGSVKGGKKRETVLAHRLVAQAFIPNPENKPQVNHKDSARDNNNVDNLEWCTCSENAKHGHRHGFRTTPKALREYATKLTPHQVKRIRLMKEVTPKLSQRKIGRMFGVTDCPIIALLKGKTWKHI
jgi:hypothetical protein